MKKKIKKKYEKPLVTKVRLETKISVLAVCKTTASSGPPVLSGCQFLGSPCQDLAS